MDGEGHVPKTGRDYVIKNRSNSVDILNDISDASQDINSSDVSNRSRTGSPASEEQSEFDAENEKLFSSSKSPSSSSSILLNDTHFQRKNSWNSDGLSTTSSSRSTTSESSYSWSTSSGISSYESRNENHKSETPSPRKPPTTNKSSSMKMKSVSMISSRNNQNSWESGSNKERTTRAVLLDSSFLRHWVLLRMLHSWDLLQVLHFPDLLHMHLLFFDNWTQIRGGGSVQRS